ncbi:hypothetical protein ACS0PU_009702 [Formica fusca]
MVKRETPGKEDDRRIYLLSHWKPPLVPVVVRCQAATWTGLYFADKTEEDTYTYILFRVQDNISLKESEGTNIYWYPLTGIRIIQTDTCEIEGGMNSRS